PSPSTWLVNGSRARPLAGPEPRRLGQAPELLGMAIEPEHPHREGPVRHESPAGRNGHAAPAGGNGRDHAPPESAPGPEGRGPAPSGHAPIAAPHPAPSGGPARIIEAFQETMRAFLDVQQATMLAYLSGRPGATAPSILPVATPTAPVPAREPPPERI